MPRGGEETILSGFTARRNGNPMWAGTEGKGQRTAESKGIVKDLT